MGKLPIHSDVLQLDCVRQQRRCWRCRAHFSVLIAPFELEPYYLYRCDSCGAYRFLPDDEMDRLSDLYDRLQVKITGCQVCHTQKQFNKFLYYFIRYWVPPCECGGKYHRASQAPARCPQCSARSLPSFFWRDDTVRSEPMTKLPYTAPSL